MATAPSSDIIECKGCAEPTGPLEVFPGELCIACWVKDPRRTTSAHRRRSPGHVGHGPQKERTMSQILEVGTADGSHVARVLVDVNSKGDLLEIKVTDEGLILERQTVDGEVTATWGATAVSMDLEPSDLTDLFDRAEAAWEAIVGAQQNANERSEPRPIPYAATDDMTLGELINIAQERVSGYHQWTRWLDHSYDPAKAALVELLQQYDVVDQKEDTQS